MKKSILFVAMFFAASAFSQSFSKLEFEGIYKKRDLEKIYDAINKDAFVKESGTNPVKMVKKAFNKRQQTMFEEVITVQKDTLTYSFSDPKKYTKFKESIDSVMRKHSQDTNGNILFTSGSRTYVLYETDEPYDGKLVKFYNFKFFIKDE